MKLSARRTCHRPDAAQPLLDSGDDEGPWLYGVSLLSLSHSSSHGGWLSLSATCGASNLTGACCINGSGIQYITKISLLTCKVAVRVRDAIEMMKYTRSIKGTKMLGV